MDTNVSKLIETLKGIDTPTVCNALLTISKDLRGKCYTVDPVIPANPSMSPVTGYALTARICSSEPTKASPEAMEERRHGYYRYLASAIKPAVVIMEDCGERPGFGCFWGEINVAIHKGLGISGTVTNGAVRDIGAMDPNYQLLGGNVCPGSGFAHLVDHGKPVRVFGLDVSPNDLVHVDRHGCVVIPANCIDKLPAAIERILRCEKELLAATVKPGFGYDALLEAWSAFEKGKYGSK